MNNQEAVGEGPVTTTPGLLDAQEAIELLKTTPSTFYRWLHTGRIQGIKVGRQWRFERSAIEAFLRGEKPKAELTADPTPLISTLEAHFVALGVGLPILETDPVGRIVGLILVLALRSRATDVHLDPLRDSDQVEPRACLRFRLDGVLHERASFDTRLLPAIIEQFKVIANCDVLETSRPQHGNARVQLAKPVGNEGEEESKLPPERTFVMSFLPTFYGESLTMRILGAYEAKTSLDQLDLPPEDLQKLRQQLDTGHGLVIMSGLTGSGKTTTLLAALREVTRPGRKVMSIEDPIEMAVPGVVQVQVDQDAGLSFAAGLKAIMKSDPDVVLVGEIQDRDSLVLANQVAATGHLVLTQLHADTAGGALRRILDLGADPLLASDAIRAVVAHRLVRRLCPECSVPEAPTEAQIEKVRAVAPGFAMEGLSQGFRKPHGCPLCAETGFRGRKLLAEVLVMTPHVRSALMDGEDRETLQTMALQGGMTPMIVQGLWRAAKGEVTLEEVLATCPTP